MTGPFAYETGFLILRAETVPSSIFACVSSGFGLGYFHFFTSFRGDLLGLHKNGTLGACNKSIGRAKLILKLWWILFVFLELLPSCLSVFMRI